MNSDSMNVYLLVAILFLSILGIVVIPPLVSPEAFTYLQDTIGWLSEHILQISMAIAVVGIVVSYFMKKTYRMLAFAGMLLISIAFRL